MTVPVMLQIRTIKRPVKSLPASVPSFVSERTARETFEKMVSAMTRIAFAIVAVVILLCMVDYTEANYKNAPMNGIMFGKRGPTEYDSRSKAFTALCEIATEACQTWFPSQENK